MSLLCFVWSFLACVIGVDSDILLRFTGALPFNRTREFSTPDKK